MRTCTSNLRWSSSTSGNRTKYAYDGAGRNTAVYFGDGNESYAVTSLTRSGNVATATSAGHGYVNGDYVTIAGASPSAFNGTFAVYDVTTDTFKYTMASSPGSDASGTITATGWADADDVAGDTVLEQADYQYDDDGNVIFTATRQRFHSATGTGALGYPGSSQPKARVYYSESFYDAANRLTAGVDLGTYGGGSLSSRPDASVPARSDTKLVTSIEYEAGEVQLVSLTGSPTGGTFTLTFGGQTTSGIAYNATAAQVQSALEALSSIDAGDVRVSGADGGPWAVAFVGTLAGTDVAAMTASGAGLTGGTSPGVDVDDDFFAADPSGRVVQTLDPRGLVTRTTMDALGRTTKLVENFDPARAGGDPTGSYNRTTETTYNGMSRVRTLAAVLPDGPDAGTALDRQTTTYLYGVVITGVGGGNDVASNDLLYGVAYPNEDDGTSSSSSGAAYTDTFKYNALGEVKKATDRNGTVHEYTFDVLGRLTADAVTTLGANVDDAVLRLEYSYDTAGRPEKFTSYDDDAGGNVVNQVQRAYNGLGQVTAEYQSHSGAVNVNSSPKVQYTYSEMSGGANHSRLTKVTYPNGRVLRYEYSSGLDANVSRVSFLADDSSGSVGTHLEEYTYLGLATIVERNRPEPGVKLTYDSGNDTITGDGGDRYVGLDRFGRVADQRWYKSSTSSDLDRFGYGYDRNSNRTSRDVLGASNPGTLDESYTYDGLDRLTKVNRGSLASGTISDANAAWSQSWGLDLLGNWETFTTDTNGGGAGGATTQTRRHDFQNRLSDMDTVNANGNEPTYDDGGNMTADEGGNDYAYDAWGRLVSYDGSSDRTYAYDALGRRVVEEPATPLSAADDTHLYYTLGWQLVEERVGSSNAASVQDVWGLGYVDQLVLRDRDADANGGTGSLGKPSSGLEQRLYVQQDANFNVTSLTDTSGTVVERYLYEAYGKRSVLNADWSADGAEDDYAMASGFQGGRHDAATADVHFRNRDLDVELGRWKTADPLGYVDGMSRYEFVRTNPQLLRDALGLSSEGGSDSFDHDDLDSRLKRWSKIREECVLNGDKEGARKAEKAIDELMEMRKKLPPRGTEVKGKQRPYPGNPPNEGPGGRGGARGSGGRFGRGRGFINAKLLGRLAGIIGTAYAIYEIAKNPRQALADALNIPEADAALILSGAFKVDASKLTNPGQSVPCIYGTGVLAAGTLKVGDDWYTWVGTQSWKGTVTDIRDLGNGTYRIFYTDDQDRTSLGVEMSKVGINKAPDWVLGQHR